MPASSPATLPPPYVVIETMTPSPVPTVTLIPSPTPTIEELIFPYTIDGLRQHEYRSGSIQIRFTLEKNEFYTSYFIDYPSDGLTITGVMQIPAGKGPFPVIVMNHGYFNRDVYISGDGTDRASAYLVKRGYITIASDYRSWGDSDIGYSFFYSGLVIDVINLLNAIPSIPQANPSRIGIWGHSMGGGVTMKVLTVTGGQEITNDNDGQRNPFGTRKDVKPQVRAAVLYSAVSADDADIIGRWGIGCFGDIAAGEQIIGCNSSDIIPLSLPLNLQDAYKFAANDMDTLEKISPFYHLNYVTVPIQIHYGMEDGKFIGGTPPEWSKKLYQGLEDAGKDAQLLGYEEEGHSFGPDPWFAFMGRVGRFFDLNVRNAK